MKIVLFCPLFFYDLLLPLTIHMWWLMINAIRTPAELNDSRRWSLFDRAFYINALNRMNEHEERPAHDEYFGLSLFKKRIQFFYRSKSKIRGYSCKKNVISFIIRNKLNRSCWFQSRSAYWMSQGKRKKDLFGKRFIRSHFLCFDFFNNKNKEDEKIFTNQVVKWH